MIRPAYGRYQRPGLTIGNLYDYIQTKEDILSLFFYIFHSMRISAIDKERIIEMEDPAFQLETAVQKMFKLTTEHRDMILFMYRELKSLPKNFLKITLEKENGLVSLFEKIIRTGVKKDLSRYESFSRQHYRVPAILPCVKGLES